MTWFDVRRCINNLKIGFICKGNCKFSAVPYFWYIIENINNITVIIKGNMKKIIIQANRI